jgi:hypothetical protein
MREITVKITVKDPTETRIVEMNLPEESQFRPMILEMVKAFDILVLEEMYYGKPLGTTSYPAGDLD